MSNSSNMEFENAPDLLKGDMPTISPGDIPKIMEIHCECDFPAMFYSPPGCGKTEGVEKGHKLLAEKYGKEFAMVGGKLSDMKDDKFSKRNQYGLITEYLSTMEPSDMRGLCDLYSPAVELKSSSDLLDVLEKEIERKSKNGNDAEQLEFLKDMHSTIQSRVMSQLQDIQASGSVEDAFSRRRTYYARPDFMPLPEDGFGGIIFLDELTAALPDVQAAAYNFVREKRVGRHKIEGKWTIFCAGNDVGDQSVAYQMSKAMATRMAHYLCIPEVEEWIRWGIDAGNIVPGIIAYHRWKKGTNLISFQRDNSQAKTFANPRTWKRLSDYMRVPNLTQSEIERGSRAIIGSAVGFEFAAYQSIESKLPRPEEVLEKYKMGGKWDWPSEGKHDELGNEHYTFDATSMVIMMISNLAARANQENAEAILRAALHLQQTEYTEYGVKLIMDAARRDKNAICRNRLFTEWCSQNPDLIKI